MGFLDATGVTTLVEKLRTKFASQSDLNGKQPTLVSGTNIKTINGNSLLGGGDLQVGGLPSVSASDNGKVLTVVNGAWAAASLPVYDGTVI